MLDFDADSPREEANKYLDDGAEDDNAFDSSRRVGKRNSKRSFRKSIKTLFKARPRQGSPKNALYI